MKCKRCGKTLTGKQTSYCSQTCSKLHLKSLYKKRNKEKVNTYNRKWKKKNKEKYFLQRLKYSQKKRLEKIQNGEVELLTSFLKFFNSFLKNGKLIHIIECKKCNKKFESKRIRKYCNECRNNLGNKKLRFEIFKRDNFTCQYCGRKSPNIKLQIDHKHPKSRGGLNEIENYTTACFDCNIGKRDVLLEEYIRKGNKKLIPYPLEGI